MIDFFVRNRGEWFDVRTIVRHISWNKSKIYQSLYLLVDYGVIKQRDKPSDSRAKLYAFDEESETGILFLTLYSKLKERV